MRVLKVVIENWGSFQGEHTLVLTDRGLVFVEGQNFDEPKMESNGSGKSTMFDAIDWCFFGKVPKGDSADSVVNQEEGSHSAVTVHLADHDRPYTVQRFRRIPGNGLRLWSGCYVENLSDAGSDEYIPHEMTSMDQKETQRSVEKVLGLDRSVFHAAVYRAQGADFNFAKAGDAERKKILAKILQLEELDAWLDNAKEAAKKNGEALVKAQQLQVNLEVKIAALQSQDAIDISMSEWEKQREQRVDQLRAQYTQRQQEYGKLEELVRDIPVFKQEFEAIDMHIKHMPRYSADAGIDSMKKDLVRAQESVRQKRNDISAIERDRDAMISRGEGSCSLCKQYLSNEQLQAEVEGMNVLINSLGQEKAQIESHIPLIQGSIQDAEREERIRLGEYNTSLSALNRQHGELRVRYENAQKADHEARRVKASLDEIQRQGEATKAEINPFIAKKQEQLAQLAQLQSEMQKAVELSEKFSIKQQYLDFWVAGFGRQGMKGYVLDAKLPEMNDAVNEWVHLLTGGTIWVRFESQTANTTGELAERFNLRIWRYNPDGTITERNYKSWSGGEKARVDIGIDFGLARLVAARATKSYDLVILDEIFRHLDSAGRDAVMELLQYISRDKSSIFVVDHDSNFKGSFEHVMTVRKQNGRSTITN